MKNKNKLKGKELIRHHLCLLMESKSYDDISVTDICESANISRMSFYRYFSKKDDVFIDYTDERFADFFDKAALLKKHDPETFLKLFFSYIKKYKKQLLILKAAKREFLLLPQFQNYAKYLLARSQDSKMYKDVDKTTVIFISGGIYSLLLSWMDENMKTPPAILAIKLVPMLNRCLKIK